MPISNTALRSNKNGHSPKSKKKTLSPVEFGQQYYDWLMEKKTATVTSNNKVPTNQRMTVRKFASASKCNKTKGLSKKQEEAAYAKAWSLKFYPDKTSIEDLSDDEESFYDEYDDAVALNEVELDFRPPNAEEQQSIVSYVPGANTAANQQMMPAFIQVPGHSATSIQSYNNNNEDSCCVSETTTSIQPYNTTKEYVVEEEEVSTVASTATASRTVTRQKRFTTKVTFEYTTTFEEGKEEEGGNNEEIISSNQQHPTTSVFTSGYQKDKKTVTCTREVNLKETMRFD